MSFTQSKSASIYRSSDESFENDDLKELSNWINSNMDNESIHLSSEQTDDGEHLRVIIGE